MPSSSRKPPAKYPLVYILLVLGITLLGWNIAQFWVHSNYVQDAAVNLTISCLALPTIMLDVIEGQRLTVNSEVSPEQEHYRHPLRRVKSTLRSRRNSKRDMTTGIRQIRREK
jgi:hypothetical protein